jgi:membrane-associated phospholipid phosphatase
MLYSYEWLVVAYFIALAGVAPFTNAKRGKKWRALLLSSSIIVLVVAGSRGWSAGVRAWLPHVYLLGGYWIPALLAPATPDPAFEAWLLRTEAALRRYTIKAPGWIVPGLELSYLMCYVLVPASFAVVWSYGTGAQIDRFWLSILLSGYACYWTVPWMVSRPPRLIAAGAMAPLHAIASVNRRVLAGVSHGLITFPSGHAAVATAAALAVFPVSRTGGIATGIVAAGIAAGATVGGYHFAIDVILGVIIGLVAALAATF